MAHAGHFASAPVAATIGGPMLALAGPLYVAAVLLVIGGAPKALQPAATARALQSVGLPRSETLVRLMGASEIGIGAAALAFGGAISAALVASAYVGFTGFVVAAMRKGGSVSSCGCFGTDDTPPTYFHLVIDVGLAAVAIAAVLDPVPAVVEALGETPLAGMPFVALVALASWFAYLALSVLPTVVPPGAHE